MVIYELEGVEIDQCVSCRGIWLDRGEIETLTTLAGVKPDRLSTALKDAAPIRTSDRRCPRCERKMHIIVVGTQNPMELDRCPNGHGLWFDAGELQQTIANFEEGEEGAVGRHFARLFAHELKSKT